jgi:hypothetical protein
MQNLDFTQPTQARKNKQNAQMEAAQRAKAGGNPFGMAQPEKNALQKMADNATLGKPVTDADRIEAERLQKAIVDKQAIDDGLRKKAIEEAINPPEPQAPAPAPAQGGQFFQPRKRR